MCLYTSNIKAVKANKDIVVVKGLVKLNENEWQTPYRKTKVSLNSVMKPKDKDIKLFEDYPYNYIGAGVIHSFTHLNESRDYTHLVKAIIKAGTDIYVRFSGEYCASTELEITDVIVDDNNRQEIEDSLKETQNTLCELLRGQLIGKNNVKVGDVLLSDKKTFVTPDNINDDMNVIGIVGFIKEDGQPHIIGLHQALAQWCVNGISEQINKVQNWIQAMKEPNGKGNTKRLKKKFVEKLEDFPALNYCLNYNTDGTEKGDWYFASIGEVAQTIRNTVIINNTVEILNNKKGKGYADKIRLNWCYWSSSEANDGWAWIDSTFNSQADNAQKTNGHQVYPSLAFHL